MTVTWGLLSTARINDKVLAGARAASGVEVVAVASRDAERARRYADERGIERSHGSYEALLEDPGVQAVYISLPNGMHVDWSIQALQAGKHVLCEKPLSCSEAQARRAFDAADAADRLLMEAFMWRHNPQTKRMRELVAEGAIGRLRAVQSAFSFRLQDAGDVRLSGPLEGGGLADVGCYCVSAARLLAGEPQRVYGEAIEGGASVDVAFSGVMRFPDGVLAHFDCGLQQAGRSHLEVVGEEGTLYLGDPFHAVRAGITLVRGGHVEEVAFERRDSYAVQMENMSAAIEGRASALLGREDALGQARTLEALLCSAQQGSPVEL